MSIEDEEAAMWDDETAWAAEQERLEKLWEEIEQMNTHDMRATLPAVRAFCMKNTCCLAVFSVFRIG